MNKKLENKELHRLSPDDYKSARKNPVIVVLDNVRSAHNVGSAFRTGDGFNIEAIYICGISPKPPQKDVLKTALGACDTVTWQYFENTAEAVKKLKSAGYKIFSIEQAQQKTWLGDVAFDANQKIAFVFGHEVFGVNQEIINLSDEVIEIPQFGTKHSLNVSVSLGIVLWEYIRGLKNKSRVS